MIRSPSKRVPGRASAVGWNWQNSRSARSAPAAAARTGPAPIAPRGLVVRRHSAAAPPVASTVAAAAIGPASVITPWQRSPSLHSAVAEVLSRTSIRGSAATIAASFEVISWPVWLPPEWTMRRLAWPPSSPSASAGPSWSRSKTTPRAQLAHRAGGLVDQHLHRRGPAEAAPGGDRVGGVAGGRVAGLERRGQPPWAQKLALWESGVRETRQTEPPPSAARSAVQRPAAPPPTTATSNSAAAAIAAQPLGGSTRSGPAARQQPPRGRAPRRRRPSSPASAARRSAASTRFSAASAWASISPRRSSAAAIACSLASRSRCSSSSWLSRSSSRAWAGRGAPSPGPPPALRSPRSARCSAAARGDLRRRLQLALGVFDLRARGLAAGFPIQRSLHQSNTEVAVTSR